MTNRRARSLVRVTEHRGVGPRRADAAGVADGRRRSRHRVVYGPALPTEADLRLCGDVSGKRVLDLGCGSGENAIALASQGAHVIAVDASAAQLALGAQARRRTPRCASSGTRATPPTSRSCAPTRSTSRSRPGCSARSRTSTASSARCTACCARARRSCSRTTTRWRSRSGATATAPGALPLGALEVRRSYFDAAPVERRRTTASASACGPRTIADVFAALHRAGYRVDVAARARAGRCADPGPTGPAASSGGPARKASSRRPSGVRMPRAAPDAARAAA